LAFFEPVSVAMSKHPVPANGASSAAKRAKLDAGAGTSGTNVGVGGITITDGGITLSAKLPGALAAELAGLTTGVTAGSVVADYAAGALADGGATEMSAQSTIESKLGNKTVALDNPSKTTAATKIKKHTKGPGLSAKRRKELGSPIVEADACKYKLYLPLHQLWTKYITHLLKGAGGPIVGERLIKADYHGAIMTVVRSTCPAFVGTRGIILQETENVFRFITKKNEVKTIPKAGNVFGFQHGEHFIQVYGNHIKFKASERAVRKFKAKPTIAL